MATTFESAKNARDVWRSAGDTFSKTVARLYPIGSRVKVTLGRARVTLQVTEHFTWDPGRVHGVNVATGKARRFCAGFHDAEVVGGKGVR